MAERNWDTLTTLSRNKRVISGSFAPNGASALVDADTYGYGFTVVRTSAGVFTITFADKYRRLQAVTATLQLATGDDKYMQVGSYDASAKTLVLRVWDASDAAAGEVAANANNRVHFTAIFDDTLQV